MIWINSRTQGLVSNTQILFWLMTSCMLFMRVPKKCPSYCPYSTYSRCAKARLISSWLRKLYLSADTSWRVVSGRGRPNCSGCFFKLVILRFDEDFYRFDEAFSDGFASDANSADQNQHFTFKRRHSSDRFVDLTVAPIKFLKNCKT